MPVILGNTPASSGVTGEEPLSSSVCVAVSTTAGAIAAGCAMVAGGTMGDAAGTTDDVFAFAKCVLRPSFHHTPAPRATAINTTAATTKRPGGGDLSRSGATGVGSTTATALDLEFSAEINSGLGTELAGGALTADSFADSASTFTISTAGGMTGTVSGSTATGATTRREISRRRSSSSGFIAERISSASRHRLLTSLSLNP